MTPYNMAAGKMRNLQASITELTDPGAGGVILLNDADWGYVELEAAGTYTLEPALRLPLGTTCLCNPTAAGITVEAEAIADGSYRWFSVIRNATRVKVWGVSG